MRPRPLRQALETMATAHRLRKLLVLVIVIPALMFVALAGYEHRRIASGAQAALDQTSRIVEEHAAKALETNEVMLGRVMQLLGDRDTDALAEDEASLHAALVRITARYRQIRNVVLWRETGEPILSTLHYPAPRHVSVADRPFFIRHKHEHVKFSINEPLDGRLGGERIFNMSQRRTRGDGRFAGVVSISLSPGYFSDFYRRVIGEERALGIALVRHDGEVVAGHSAAREDVKAVPASALVRAMKQGIADGVLPESASGDRRARYMAFRRVSSYPLYVVVTRSRASVFAEWWHDMMIVSLFFFPGAFVVTFAAWLALKKTRDEHQRVLEHHEEEVRRRAMEDHLRQLEKFEAIGQLTSGLAHDFNNLLHVVSMHAFALKRLPPHADRSKHLAAIEHSVSSGEALVTHLLAFARRKALTLETLDIGSALPPMCELVRHSLPRAVGLVCTVEPDLKPVKADRAELELALMNLVVNARDAMGGAGLIEVSVRHLRSGSREGAEAGLPDRDFVALSVADDGAGIPDALLERVFEPFFTTKQEAKGSGLGLSRVHGYAVQLGGTARARNRPEGGAMITLYLPAAISDPPALPAKAPPQASEATLETH